MIPRFTFGNACLCFDDGEAGGRYITIRWGRFVVELTLARFSR